MFRVLEISSCSTGSFILLPLFLIWIDVTWIIILTGATLAYVLQNRVDEDGEIYQGGALLPLIGLDVFVMIASAFSAGTNPIAYQ